jgi:flagellar FliJ protein
MARFTFRLEPVLAHRQRLEDEQQVQFAAALARVVEVERMRDDFIARRTAMRERIRIDHAAMEADELRATYAHCDYLDREIVKWEGVLVQARKLADDERAILLERTKDKKILETLKERRRETFDLEAASIEQRETDEINARRFDRAVTRETSV